MEQKINQAIKKAIHLCGSQSALARACSVTQPTVNGWLNGSDIGSKHLLSIEQATEGKVTIREICEALKDAQNA